MTWKPDDSAVLYNVQQWGGGYFRVNAQGNVEVGPQGPEAAVGSEPTSIGTPVIATSFENG